MGKRGSKKKQTPEQVRVPVPETVAEQTPPPPKIDEANPPETTGGEQSPQAETPVQPQTITLPPASEDKTITIKEAETLTSKTWLYHETEEPRVFPAGSAIPDGWQRSPRFPSFTWSQVNETEWGKGSRAKWIKRERERKG